MLLRVDSRPCTQIIRYTLRLHTTKKFVIILRKLEIDAAARNTSHVIPDKYTFICKVRV